ncbi:hypothetical protein [Amycolatopsis sp. SID8362]|uniref:hypothetical protein n=1 Tax=Amycolatopsis sp. SID8362 TaxID=2690346 RepID=UPI001942D0B1|nr:hypothetical protein [Amycolatopsis sp. SID8362]
MSIEAISWALNAAEIPRKRRDASSLAIVLAGLANHAGPDGCNAFPSIGTLTRYTRLSERSVRTRSARSGNWSSSARPILTSVSARVIWLDEDRQRSVPCPRCHPSAATQASGGIR